MNTTDNPQHIDPVRPDPARLLSEETRERPEPVEVTITRAEVDVPAVSWRLLDGDTAHVRLSSFDDDAGYELRAALEQAQAQGAQAIVLDLRNNPGGLLDQAIDVSDAFLERGEIVSQRGREKDDIERYYATPGDGIFHFYFPEQGLVLPGQFIPGADSHSRAYGAYGTRKLYGKEVEGVLRSTFVIDEAGNVELAQYNVKATGHVAKLRRDLGLA